MSQQAKPKSLATSGPLPVVNKENRKPFRNQTLKLKKKPSEAKSELVQTTVSKVFYDQNWATKEEFGFKVWLNHWLVGEPAPAPSSSESCFIKLKALKEQALLRRKALQLLHALEDVITRLEAEVYQGRIAIRTDREIHDDVGAVNHILGLLQCFQPQWLRLGVEAVYHRVIADDRPDDEPGTMIRNFLREQFFCNPEIEQQFAFVELKQNFDPARPIRRYRDGFKTEMKKFTLCAFLKLVFFVDKCKECQLFEGNPCLFKKTAPFKTTRDLVIEFAKEYLSGEGDVIRHLALLRCDLLCKQTPLQEFDYTVSNLSQDMRDGVRLTRLAELILASKGQLTTNSSDDQAAIRIGALMDLLRLPADSRLRKVHNVGVALEALQKAALPIRTTVESLDHSSTMTLRERMAARAKGTLTTKLVIKPEDVVDGHREKTLALLWTIVLHWGINRLLSREAVEHEIAQIRKSSAQSKALIRHLTADDMETEAGQMTADLDVYMASDLLQALLGWVKAVAEVQAPRLTELHGHEVRVPVHNFSNSFSDGRVLCLLINYYQPALLPLEAIRMIEETKHEWELTEAERAQIKAAKEAEAARHRQEVEKMREDREKWSAFYSLDTISDTQHERNLKAAKANFKLLHEKLQQLGSIPLMIRSADMLDGVPDEKVVIAFVAHLCVRLIAISTEVHATRAIQHVWRKRQAKKAAVLALPSAEDVAKQEALAAQQKQAAELAAEQERLRLEEAARVAAEAEAKALFELEQQRLAAAEQAARKEAARLLQLQLQQQLELEAEQARVAAELEAERLRQQQQAELEAELQRQQAELEAELQRQAVARAAEEALLAQEKARKEAEEAEQRRVELEMLQQLQEAERQRERLRLEEEEKLAIAREQERKERAWAERKARQAELQRRIRMQMENNAAITIQCAVRRCLSRRVYKNMVAQEQQRQHAIAAAKEAARVALLQQQTAAATALQCAWRGRCARKVAVALREEAAAEQRRLAELKAALELKAQQEAAALVLQSLVRWRLAKAAVQQKQALIEQQEREAAAAAALQRKQNAAAITMQCAWRCFTAKRVFREAKAEREALHHRCATLLQRVWHRCVARQGLRKLMLANCEFKLRTAAAVEIQSAIRLRQAQRLVAQLRFAEAERQRRAREETAAVQLQRMARGWMARLTVQRYRARVTKATVAIQCLVRSRQAVRVLNVLKAQRLTQQQSAALGLQNAVRCWRARQTLALLQRQKAEREEAERQRLIFEEAERQRLIFEEAERQRLIREEQQRQATASACIQRGWKCFLARRTLAQLRKHRQEQITEAALRIQCVVRRMQAQQRLQLLRLTFQQRQNAAAVRLQCAWRVHCARAVLNTLRSEHQILLRRRHAAAMLIQAQWRGYTSREQFALTKQAAIVVQCAFRRLVARRALVARREAVHRLRQASALLLQSVWRGMQARRVCEQLWQAEQLRRRVEATEALQAALQCVAARVHLATLRSQWHQKRGTAATVLQAHVRAWLLGKKERAEYLQLRSAVRTVVHRRRCVRVLRAVRECARLERQRVQAVLAEQKRYNAALSIQCAARGLLALKRVAVIKAQRAEDERLRILREQELAREREALRQQKLHSAALVTQSVWRGRTARQQAALRLCNIVRIQSLWRGRVVRCRNTKKVNEACERIRVVSENVPEHKKIGNRTKSALEVLLESKQLTVVTNACKTLDIVTNLLPSCCEQAVAQNAVPVILALMQSCNRSQPHLELVKYGLNVLRNLAVCPSTCRSVFEPENLVDVMVEQMQIYRDKEDIFLKAVTLLRVGSKLPGYTKYLRSKQEDVKRMRGLLALLTHKLKLQEKTASKDLRITAKTKESHLKRCVEALSKLLAALDGTAAATERSDAKADSKHEDA